MPVTITKHSQEGRRLRVKFTWESGDGDPEDAGVTSGTTDFTVQGDCVGFGTTPGAGGSAPTDNYDLTLSDADGEDVLAGQGANRSATLRQRIPAYLLGHVANSKLTFAVAAAGDTKTGVAYADFLLDRS